MIIYLKKIFTEILNNQKSDQASFKQSCDLLNKFNGFKSAYLVVTFNVIFGLADVLHDVLQKKSFDINFCISKFRNLCPSPNLLYPFLKS